MSKWIQANSTNKKLDQNSRKKKRERERDEKCTCAFPHVITVLAKFFENVIKSM
jgi:hypothetical protein